MSPTLEWPQLQGYNGTVEKDAAQVVLVASDGSPVLAQWQFGLGRAVAWTSDLKGQWAANWVNWSEFPRFVAQMVGWTLPRISGDTVSGEASLVGTDVQIDVAANDADDNPQTGLTVEARMVGPSGTPQPQLLQEVGPGRYQARVPSPIPGTYLVQLTGTDQNGKPVFARTLGLIVPYSPEYRQGQSNLQLLETLARESGGRSLSQPAQAFDHTLAAVRRAIPIELALLLLAALLLPLDIAVRRLSLRRKDFALVQARRRERQQAAAAPSATMTSLQGAKGRARERMFSDPDPIKTQAAAAARPPTPPLPSEPAGPAAPPVAAEESADPLERLRAAKKRARRQ